MATQVIGSLAINDLLPIQARGAGAASFGPVAVPRGYSTIFIQFDLQQITSLTVVFTATLDLSFDNGANWQSQGAVGLDLAKSGYVLTAGVLTRGPGDPVGQGPVRVFGVRLPLFQTESTTRQVRGTLTQSEAVTSGVTVVAY